MPTSSKRPTTVGGTMIHAERLGKRYRLGRTIDPHRTLRDAVTDAVVGAGRRAGRLVGLGRRDGAGEDAQDFWALRDVSFEVRSGEAVGLIGGNGAGKSTLLKLLSRITVPTSGRAEIRGRVGSLLEVGTGFHPDLTGRENTYLNGAILGMRNAEIARKFDEIVAFAGVERFIDTPVKRYSSGMYLRLAFAVAAHLEPEVLLVDEVLAVGDAAFQRKCLGKMGDVARQGRTVFLVSHNMEAVQRLCTRALLMEGGRLVADGPSHEVTARYLQHASEGALPGQRIDLEHAERRGTGEVRFVEATYRSPSSAAAQLVPSGPLEVELVLEATRPLQLSSLAVIVTDTRGQKLLNADIIVNDQLLRLDTGRNTIRVVIEGVHLNPGRFVMGLWAAEGLLGDPQDYLERAFEFEIIPAPLQTLGMTPVRNGLVSCRFSAERIA